MQSFEYKSWRILDGSDLSILEKLFKIRDIEPRDVERFLDPKVSELHHPSLFKDMEKAMERVFQAIEKQERIIVFGDYDVDGVTATATMVKTLIKLGALVSYRIPHRVEDGYGLKDYLVDEIAEKNVKLIITVDNGISCFHEVAHAKSKNIDVIITDHHAIPENIPDAYAIIHPKMPNETYPFSELAGSGVAFLFAWALLEKKYGKEEAWEILPELLEFACLGTIADCVPLIGDNRILTTHGIKALKNSHNPGLRALMHISGITPKELNTYSIEYALAPRINAGGRMDTALIALHLLLFPEQKSMQLAQELHDLNIKRQEEVKKIAQEADKNIDPDLASDIILSAGEWHIGVLGIVASRLGEKYSLPTILLGKKDDIYVASCRSNGHIDIFSFLSQFRQFFLHFGGHEAAAGFSIKADVFEEFCKAMKISIKEAKKREKTFISCTLDTLITGNDIHLDLYHHLSKFEPFGTGNERPIFGFEKSMIVALQEVGKEKQHLKMILQHENQTFESMLFTSTKQRINKIFNIGDVVDVAFHIEKNEFQGKKKINLIIQDILI